MSIVVDTFVMGPYRSNCYVLRGERGASEAVVVDPGDDPTPLRLELARMGARTAGVLVTHTDVDHIAGVAALAEGTGSEVWAPAGEVEALRTGETRGGLRVGAHDPSAHGAPAATSSRSAGSRSRCSTCPVTRSATSRTSSDDELFSGDLLFAGSVGRVDLEGGDWETLLDSVRSLLDRLPPDTVLYPGHGPTTTLGRELQTNPFLSELRAAQS